MIRHERLTVKAGEALQQAVGMAGARGNPVANDAHLFLALLQQEEGIVVPVLQKSGLNVTELVAEVEREIERLPTQEGRLRVHRAPAAGPGRNERCDGA
jgi:ATP-dependent Clp protease ATP-binding subunit ClpB